MLGVLNMYPVIEGKYRFLGGMNCPKELWELRVGEGYEAEPKGRDYIIRGHKTIIISKYDFEKYFEPYIDYGYEGDGRYALTDWEQEEKRDKIEIKTVDVWEEITEKELVEEGKNDIDSENIKIDIMNDDSTHFEQLSLF
jgi:hypothetical protein